MPTVASPTLNVELLMRLNTAIPRYTSYPTAPEWGDVEERSYEEQLEILGKLERPLSLYFHIPFCKTMCLYCGCSVILNRKPENEERYVDYLCKEIDLVADRLGGKPRVPQIHFGGGTPTKLSIPFMERLFEHINKRFEIDYSQEVAIEIDPRTVLPEDGAKLRHLRKLGFNRVSFGVQDTNPQVQEAVKRHQTLEMTQETFHLARELGFKGINIDLIYGLPYQTQETFHQTVEDILELGPDRIAMYSYAKIPWMKPHQKAIKDSTLPSTEEKFAIYVQARQQFLSSGYWALGMDHFGRPGDEIAQAYARGELHRNFQGYTVRLAEDMLGLGVTSIGRAYDGYFQNVKTLEEYYDRLDQGHLPTFRGKLLSEDDKMRYWVIQRLMCDFHLLKSRFSEQFDLDFDTGVRGGT